MMFSKKILSIVLVSIFFFNTTIIYGENIKGKNTLIIYESTNEFSHAENKLNNIKQLLYVFNTKVDTININQYKSKQIEEYDYVLVTDIEQDIENEVFLRDLSNFNNNIYWLGDRVENYTNYSKKYNITYKGISNNITKLNYKGNDMLVKDKKAYNIVSNSEGIQILSSMSDGYNTYPFVLREKNLFYISEYYIGDNFIFEDTLNDFYGIESYREGEVFVSIEDVHSFSNTKKLMEIADYLYSQNIPFIISLTPAVVDNETGNLNTLDSNPEFIKTIKYMQQKGGSVILHGYTHQLGEEEISGEGYEFWDIKNNKPIQNIDTYVKNRILSGLRRCVENDIYPLGFKAPQYAMDSAGYKEIKKYFSTYAGKYQNSDDNFVTSTFPYIIKDSSLFNVFIPENMGYIDKKDKFSVEEVKSNYNKLKIVRGYTGGFLYNSQLGLDKLKEIIEFLQDNDAKFLDLKSNYNYVKVDDISITSNDGKVTCSYDKSKSILNNEKNVKQNVFFESINDVVITFVSIILVIFLIIFIVFRKINKDKFIR